MTGISEDPAYIRLKDQLITKTGLAFYADRNEFMTGLIEARLQHLQLRDCSSYLKFLDWRRHGRRRIWDHGAGLTRTRDHAPRRCGREGFQAVTETDLRLPTALLAQHQRMEAVWRERAQRLSQRPNLARASEDERPVVVLGIGKERYGIDLQNVAEVFPPIVPTPVPGAAAVFSGVINVHGEIRPVIHLVGVCSRSTPALDMLRIAVLTSSQCWELFARREAPAPWSSYWARWGRPSRCRFCWSNT